MLQHTNIDRQDSVDVSPAPFTYTSTLDLAGVQIPAGSFLALKVYVTETALMPFRFHSIRPDGKVMICDARGTLVGYWQTYDSTEATQNKLKAVDGNIVVDPDETETLSYVSSVLLDMQGVLMGHIACTTQTIALVRRVVLSSLSTTFLDPQAFVFIPQCHVAMLNGYGRSFGIQSQTEDMRYHTGDLKVALSNDSQIYVSITSAAPDELEQLVITVGLSNKQETVQRWANEYGQNGICKLVVNDTSVNCIGKSIIIRAAATSNLRVVMENNKVVLRGVKNA